MPHHLPAPAEVPSSRTSPGAPAASPHLLGRGACLLSLVALAGACSGTSGTHSAGPAGTGVPAPASASASATAEAGSASTPTVGASTPPASASPSAGPSSTAPSVAGPAACLTAHLRISVGGGSGGAAGSTYTAVLFRNTGPACTLSGHPGVSYVAGADGHQVGNPARRELTGSTVTLQPGALAHATLRILQYGVLDANMCRPTDVRGLRVYPPGQTASTFVARPGRACASRSVTLLTVRPVQAGPPTE